MIGRFRKLIESLCPESQIRITQRMSEELGLKWPEAPHVHETINSVFKTDPVRWRPPSKGEPYHYPFRTCSYCGSIHPEDLWFALRGTTLERPLDGSDWKYGWPHKFYVNCIPNPIAGKIVNCGCESRWDHEKGKRIETPIMGEAPAITHGKFYTEHLLDVTDQKTFLEITNLIMKFTRIQFEVKDGKLFYRAPYRGFQI